MNELFAHLSQITGFETAWVFDNRGKVTAKTPSLITDETLGEMSTMLASLVFMYQKNNEPLEEVSFAFAERQVWIKVMGATMLGVMTQAVTDPAEIQSYLGTIAPPDPV